MYKVLPQDYIQHFKNISLYENNPIFVYKDDDVYDQGLKTLKSLAAKGEEGEEGAEEGKE